MRRNGKVSNDSPSSMPVPLHSFWRRANARSVSCRSSQGVPLPSHFSWQHIVLSHTLTQSIDLARYRSFWISQPNPNRDMRIETWEKFMKNSYWSYIGIMVNVENRALRQYCLYVRSARVISRTKETSGNGILGRMLTTNFGTVQKRSNHCCWCSILISIHYSSLTTDERLSWILKVMSTSYQQF